MADAPTDRLFLALDLPDPDAARALVERLGETVTAYKIGLELFMQPGYFALLDWLKGQGKVVFCDLKFFDVPATVAAATRNLASAGADFCTVHGQDGMMQAAAEAKGGMKVLAVTALTSLDRGDLDSLGFDCDVEDLVLSRATRALALGCDGVVSSGLEAPRLRGTLGSRLLIVTPGIRPVENRPDDDQKRVVDVATAFANGASHIVMGRPIRNAPDPAAAAQAVQDQIAAALA